MCQKGRINVTTNSILYLIVLNHNSSTRVINKQANQMFFLRLNVNNYQPSSLQVVGDHSGITIGPVLSVELCNFFIKCVQNCICAAIIIYISLKYK